jgi:hypothetical protein
MTSSLPGYGIHQAALIAGAPKEADDEASRLLLSAGLVSLIEVPR